MKPDTPLLQLTAREFAEMLAWHARLCQRGDFIDVDREICQLFGEPEPHQHAWSITDGKTHWAGAHGGSFSTGLFARCECGAEEHGADRHDLVAKLMRYGQAIVLK